MRCPWRQPSCFTYIILLHSMQLCKPIGKIVTRSVILTTDLFSAFDRNTRPRVKLFSSPFSGVSCDSCLKSNFRCSRYKCLICYDYDLCASCYEEGVTSTRHLSEHPMQCILTRSDFELYYGGEVLGGEQPQSFTCPFCKKMGFSESGLFEHVTNDHSDTNYEVVCPVCAALPGGDPNLVTDDFAGHLTIEHRTGNRDLITFLISFFNDI